MKVIKDHLPELNLSIDPSFLCGTPVEMKSYLMKNVIKFCLLLLDAETVKATSVNVPQLKVEYEELLKTATECVGRDICILIHIRYCIFPFFHNQANHCWQDEMSPMNGYTTHCLL